jgi:hypothetical protein
VRAGVLSVLVVQPQRLRVIRLVVVDWHLVKDVAQNAQAALLLKLRVMQQELLEMLRGDVD